MNFDLFLLFAPSLLKINVELFLQTLPIMAKGLVGIFTVTLIIILSVFVLNKITSRKPKNKDGDKK